MTTGLIGIEFDDGATEEEIQEIVSNFYGENQKTIKGMQYIEFRDTKMLKKVYEFVYKEARA